ncbi:MAG: very short patch repair endonuclease [Syntrophorhabdaceae bacterium]|nr:very short patch repair endonuclease [Syntrophorhabdaceae bacterium]
MSRIKAKDTKPEIILRKALHSAGFRFKLHCRNLPGNPDIVLPKWHTIIFVHGCLISDVNSGDQVCHYRYQSFRPILSGH